MTVAGCFSSWPRPRQRASAASHPRLTACLARRAARAAAELSSRSVRRSNCLSVVAHLQRRPHAAYSTQLHPVIPTAEPLHPNHCQTPIQITASTGREQLAAAAAAGRPDTRQTTAAAAGAPDRQSTAAPAGAPDRARPLGQQEPQTNVPNTARTLVSLSMNNSY